MMAKKKKKVSRQQGVVSWFVNVVTAVLAFANVASRATEAVGTADPWGSFSGNMIRDYTGYDTATAAWAPANMIRGWSGPIGAIAFKTVMGEATKRIRIKSLIPALRA
jgi:hypothetical protein